MRLTKQQGAVISAFTGFLSGEFADYHEYVEKIMGRSVFIHEIPSLAVEIREKAREDFIAITAQ